MSKPLPNSLETGGGQAAPAAPISFPVRAPKTAEIVAGHIRKRIIRGELKEGDFLPPEGQMMDSLRISRPTLREALRVLEAEGLISVVRGSRTGARVHQPKVQSVSRYAGFVLQAQDTPVGDVYEARLAIEPYVARKLAEQRSPEAVAKLRAEVARLTELFDDAQYIDFMIGVARFHSLLVELGGNRTLSFVTEVLRGVVERYQVEFFTRRPLDEQAQRKRSMAGVRSFVKLIELIEAGDANGAEAHWRLHLMNANAHWVGHADKGMVVEAGD
ncbi:FCD domain-containing protein [Phenylobacterium sp. LjRoot219]|uniref:FadR/GntR family transcriptional regulator n=1 Tax=Phenylobacterium sp. LjRoot219 TaxID=3342283 RepID=UPI003ECEC8FD